MSAEPAQEVASPVGQSDHTSGVENQDKRSGSLTNDEIKHRILNVYANFVSDVEPDRLFDWLLQYHVITIDQKQRIRHENSIASDKCRAILDHLFSIKHPEAFLAVLQALRQDNHYLLKNIVNQEPGPGIRELSDSRKVLLDSSEKSLAIEQKFEQERNAWSEEREQLQKQLKELLAEHEFERKAWCEEKEKLKRQRQEDLAGHELERKTWCEEKEQLKKSIQELQRDNLLYKPEPGLLQTLGTKAAETGRKAIRGLTILDREMFVVSWESSKVEVYDSRTCNFSRQWDLKELISPVDMRSCSKNKCLYIFDHKVRDQSKEILRTDSNGKLIRSWSTGDDYGHGLSVTDEANVLLTVYEKNKLIEYSPDGHPIREIRLSSDAGISHPRHAIKLTNGHFVVSHGYNDGELHRVCIVDAEGKLTKSFGGKSGSSMELMSYPIYLAVDGNGFVMVADRGNQRVLLLDSELKFIKEILSKERHGLKRVWSILLEESNGRLYVTDNEFDPAKKIFRDGRIFIFNCK